MPGIHARADVGVKMRILVTGATGFIGSRLALRARARGHDVLAAGRRLPEGLRNQFAATGIEVELGDVTQPAYVDRIMAGITHVCHLAAAWQEIGVAEDYFRRVTVDGARNVAIAATAHGVSKLVYCSTCGVHSRSKGGIISETSAIEVTNSYERAKLAAEGLLTDHATATGLPTIVLRPADGYGPGDLRLLKMFRAIAQQRFPLVGSGAGRRHLIFIDDICDAFLAACAAPASQPQTAILAGPEVVTLKELVGRIARILGVRRYGFQLPLAPMRILAAITEDVCGILKVSPPLYRRRLDFYTVNAEYNTAKSRELLHWRPQIGLDSGLRMTVDWYHQHHLI
jgi:nucleoside-diphosphate-sugar epimerase